MPMPPATRGMEPSTCVKGSKSDGSCADGMPGPSSSTSVLARSGERQEILDHSQQLVRFTAGVPEKLLSGRAFLLQPAEAVDRGDDDGERRAELVVDVAEELELEPIELLQALLRQTELAALLEKAAVESRVL